MARGADRGGIPSLIAAVRRRWRLRVALRGLAIATGLSLATLFLASFTLEGLRFEPVAVLWLRAVTWSVFLLSLLWFVLRPVLRRVSDDQVALYLEEHEPTLDHTVASALDAAGQAAVSPGLAERLSATAMERARQVRFGRRVERAGLQRFGGLLTALAVASVALVLLGPNHLRHGITALLVPTRAADTVNPYAIAVDPGSVTIARGTDQLVTAVLSGFAAAEASVFVRTDPDGAFQRLSMLAAEDGGFEVLLLGVAERTEYFVESTSIRSSTYTIDVADLPYVDRIDLTYRFPAYTGLAPRTVEDGGDVAALAGTVVEVRITPTIPTGAGLLRVDGEALDTLQVEDDGTLTGRFTVRERGFYAVELGGMGGALIPASPEYTIDVLTDHEPSIRFAKPGRDTPASPIEEVYLEIRADDDYGVGDLRLVYSVNGGPEDTVAVFSAGRTPLREVSTGHTLFLEEWELEPGDLISYYGLVRDNRGRRGEAVSSDIYFINVRPFERAYRQGEQQGGAPQGGGGQAPEAALSELQRQIIAATFNLIRQRDSYEEGVFSENVVSVSLTQARLREQVQTLVERMRNRGLVESDAGFRDVSAILPQAAAAMDSAKAHLDGERLQEALPHEQSALRFLQQAEETYERYVVEQSQQGGGGGGGGQSAAAEDLADLFELELDKLKNQYETVRRGEQQNADDQVDEVLEKLRELSRRLEQAAERQRLRAQRGAQGATGGGGRAQRELAEEAEEEARQLRRLARESAQPELEDTARRLEEAAEAMRRSAASSGAAGVAESTSALDRLEEARRRLQRAQEQRAQRDAESALRQVDELARQQRDVQDQVRSLPAGGAERRDRIERLRERKDQMTEAVSALERELDRSASVSRAEQPEASRRLRGAADQIRESKLKEKLQYSRGTIEQWDPESALTLELNIEADLQTLRDRLEEAAEQAAVQEANPLEEALEQTRDLVRGMEALDRRLRESAEPGEGDDPQSPQGAPSTDQPGAEGQPGSEARGGAGERGEPGQAEGGARSSADPSEVRGEGSPLAGGATRGDPRRLSPEEIRQLRREFLERGNEARDLRDRLSAAGQDAGDLSAVLEAMRRLQQEGAYEDPAQVAALQSQILEALKLLEFGLRREVEGPGERRATLGASEDVPVGFRKLVEEYYRKLAGGSGRGSGR